MITKWSRTPAYLLSSVRWRPEKGYCVLTAPQRSGVRRVLAHMLNRLFRDAEEALRQTKARDKAGASLRLPDMGGASIEPAGDHQSCRRHVQSRPSCPYVGGRVSDDVNRARNRSALEKLNALAVSHRELQEGHAKARLDQWWEDEMVMAQ